MAPFSARVLEIFQRDQMFDQGLGEGQCTVLGGSFGPLKAFIGGISFGINRKFSIK